MLNSVFSILALLFLVSGSVAQQTATVDAVNEYLRGLPYIEGKVVTSVKKGERVELLLERGQWSLVQAKDFVGWIRTSSVLTDRFGDSSSFESVGAGQGSGRGTGRGTGAGSGSVAPLITKPLRIVSKPRPAYTEAARSNDIVGTVILRVTFLASGQIGSIAPVKGLPFGLTEQAIAAARLIKFEAAESIGGPVSVTRTVEYSFVPY